MKKLNVVEESLRDELEKNEKDNQMLEMIMNSYLKEIARLTLIQNSPMKEQPEAYPDSPNKLYELHAVVRGGILKKRRMIKRIGKDIV
jgi:hypothetical protein